MKDISMNKIIENNIFNIMEKVRSTAKKFNRDPKNIEIIAASKYQDKEKINTVFQLGITNFGENYIQEWKKKSEHFINYLPNLKWHIIGNVQTNKAKYFNSNIYCLQTLDNIQLAQEIEKKAKLDEKLKVLIQLKIDKDDIAKSGITINEAEHLCEYIDKSQKMILHGFMGIGPAQTSIEKRRDLYYEFTNNAHNLWKNFSRDIKKGPTISLGMSSDFDIAIECGSTMLRIGSAIFGERKSNN